MVIRFTHSRRIDYFVPGVAPTHRKLEVPAVVIAQFATASWRMSTYIGTRLQSLFRRGSSRWGISQSRASRSRIRCSIPNCRAIR
jgi:hypothetical protein